jgi:hypothetical protein
MWRHEVLNSYSVDSAAKQLLLELCILRPNDKGYSLHDDLIRFKGRMWVGENSVLQTKIIQAFHSLALGGHSEIQATTHRVQKHFAWKVLMSSAPGRKPTTAQDLKRGREIE